MDFNTLLSLTLFIGAIAGWFASQLVHGAGSGLLGDIFVEARRFFPPQLTDAPCTFDPTMTPLRKLTGLPGANHPPQTKRKAHPCTRLRTIFKDRGNFATGDFRLLSPSPQSGSGNFPSGRPSSR